MALTRPTLITIGQLVIVPPQIDLPAIIKRWEVGAEDSAACSSKTTQ